MSPTPPLRLSVLGPLRVEIGSNEVDVPGAKRRAVLAMLAMGAPETVTIDHLIDAIWPGHPPTTARSALQSHVSRVRHHLGPHADRLSRRSAGYRLALEADELDASRVASLAHQAHLARRRGDREVERNLLEHALGEWRSVALDDLLDFAPLAAWSQSLVAHWIELSDHLARCDLALGSADRALDVATATLRVVPLREPGVVLAMEALATLGRPVDALRAAQDFRRQLVEETGLDPSENLSDVERLVAGNGIATARRRAPTRTSPEPINQNPMVTQVLITLNDRPLPRTEREAILARPDFGAAFTDHMVTMSFRKGRWGDLELHPFRSLSLSPAALALHYGQSVFEALKAYRQADGDIALFRPDRNAARFAASAQRIAMPPLPDGAFELACALIAGADRDWVPANDGAALYVRPFLFATEPHLSVRPADEYLFVVIASPVASYFGEHLAAITVAVESADVRATPGGTGATKFAGNYAAGFAAHDRARAAGQDQVLWLDSTEHRWIEELNAMNVMLVWDRDGRTVLTTPALTGTILPGITRDSLLSLATGAVDDVREEPTSIEQVRIGVHDGTLREAFACGTAAGIAPIGTLVHRGEPLVLGDGAAGQITAAMRRLLLDVQHGRAPAPEGWVVPVDGLLTAAGIDPEDLLR